MQDILEKQQANQTYQLNPLSHSHCQDMPKLAKTVWGIQSTPEFWKWKYSFGGEGQHGFAVHDSNSNLVAVSGYWPRHIYLYGKKIPATMMVDMMAHPEHRGGKAYRKISREAKKLPSSGLFYGFTNPISHAYYKKFLKRENNKRIDTAIPRWFLIINPLPHMLVPGTMVKIFSPLFSSLMSLRFRADQHSNMHISEVETFGEEFDTLWNSVFKSYSYIQYRGSDYLTWRYTSLPGKKYTILAAHEKGDIVGYMITSVSSDKNGGIGYIVDWLVPRERIDVFHLLIKRSISSLCGKKVWRIETWIMHHEKQWIEIVKKYWFIKGKIERTYLGFADDHILGGATIDQNTLFATMGDSDFAVL